MIVPVYLSLGTKFSCNNSRFTEVLDLQLGYYLNSTAIRLTSTGTIFRYFVYISLLAPPLRRIDCMAREYFEFDILLYFVRTIAQV
jgi:hypothetical protein